MGRRRSHRAQALGRGRDAGVLRRDRDRLHHRTELAGRNCVPDCAIRLDSAGSAGRTVGEMIPDDRADTPEETVFREVDRGEGAAAAGRHRATGGGRAASAVGAGRRAGADAGGDRRQAGRQHGAGAPDRTAGARAVAGDDGERVTLDAVGTDAAGPMDWTGARTTPTTSPTCTTTDERLAMGAAGTSDERRGRAARVRWGPGPGGQPTMPPLHPRRR